MLLAIINETMYSSLVEHIMVRKREEKQQKGKGGKAAGKKKGGCRGGRSSG